MAYLTRGEILGFENSFRKSASLQKSLRDQVIKNAQTKITVFISHSHKDSELVEGVRILLSSFEVNAFIDWKDNSMPSPTDAQTAKILKKKIEDCEKFIIISSLNSKNSTWVPWELGFADKSKGLNNIAVLPVSESTEEWKGLEYMGLYSKIKTTSNDNYGIFKPGETNGTYLKSWLLTK